jgi:hypothetical protein
LTNFCTLKVFGMTTLKTKHISAALTRSYKLVPSIFLSHLLLLPFLFDRHRKSIKSL